jgi:hypothetical protein
MVAITKAGHAQADVGRMIQQSGARDRKEEVAIVLPPVLSGDHAGI